MYSNLFHVLQFNSRTPIYFTYSNLIHELQFNFLKQLSLMPEMTVTHTDILGSG